MNVRALAAELVGTFILVALGSMAIAGAFLIGGQNLAGFLVQLAVPFGFGLALMAGIALVSHVSGAHLNPAVTLAFLLDRRIDWLHAIGYVIAQVLGALAASLTVMLILSREFVGVTRTRPGGTAEELLTSELHAFTAEIILTAVFVAVILMITRTQPTKAVIVIPLALVMIHFVGIAISGASVNPARSLAPAVVAGDYTSLWVYLTAPFIGAVIGWAVYWFFAPQGDELVIVEEEEVDLGEDIEDEFEGEEDDDEFEDARR